ncbi:YdcF family protein [Parablautia muri]|uniref:YdcF family protein n=1 Tax=Parablautia muri TaxID=2320879 RepID=A0A9X5GUI4_9FIRM|nr:YdcF family protein [Parablautia muri]NBJ94107.1 YdcF family protein [Parablautia muri]
MCFVLLLLGIIFIGYFCGIIFFTGHAGSFSFVWLFLGIGAFIMCILLKKKIWHDRIPFWFRRFFIVLVCLGGILFLVVEGCIVSGFSKKGPSGLDYLVVLGAQIKAGGPSRALQYRLDEAAGYLVENPDTKVIVSGGQGADEPVSEAQGMHDYLVEKGIAPERILMEDQSRNTFQNLVFSAELLDKEADSVGVVSNNFHVFRAEKIARKAGYQNVCGIAAKGEPFLQYNNMMREFFGVLKDFLAGNM